MAEVEKPQPLLTRGAWEVAVPTAAQTIATTGVLFGPPGLAVAAGVAAAGAGVAALSKRNRSPQARAERETKKLAQDAKRDARREQRDKKPGRGGLTAGLPRLGRRGAGAGGGRALSGGARTPGLRAGGRGLRGALGRLGGGAGKGATPRSTPTTARSGGPVAGQKKRSLLGRLSPTGRRATGANGSAGTGRRSASGGPAKAGRGAGSGRAAGRPSPLRRLLNAGRSGGSGRRRGGSATSTRPARPLLGRGSGRVAGRVAGRRPSSGAGRRSGAGWRAGGGLPGAADRASNLARARRLGQAWDANGTRSRGGRSSGSGGGGRVAGLRRAARYLTGRGHQPKSRAKSRPKRQREPGQRGTTPITRRAIDDALTPVGKRKRRSLGDTMPPSRRKPTTQPTTGGSSTSTGGSFAAPGRSPHNGVIEAAAQSAHVYEPTSALRVVEWYEGAAALIEANAQMLTIQGKKNVDEFYLHPAAGEFAVALGAQLLKYKEVVDEARHAFEVAHKYDLDKIRDPKPNQERWDISAARADQ